MEIPRAFVYALLLYAALGAALMPKSGFWLMALGPVVLALL